MAIADLVLNESAAGVGPLFVDRIQFSGDDDYPTGGTAAFEDSYQGLVEAERTIVAVLDANIGGDVLQYDHANDKLLVRQIADGAEKANEADLSGTTYHAIILSK